MDRQNSRKRTCRNKSGVVLHSMCAAPRLLLESRGGIFPALSRLGLPAALVRRSWAALQQGGWQIGTLIVGWRKQVEAGGRWQSLRVDS